MRKKGGYVTEIKWMLNAHSVVGDSFWGHRGVPEGLTEKSSIIRTVVYRRRPRERNQLHSGKQKEEESLGLPLPSSSSSGSKTAWAQGQVRGNGPRETRVPRGRISDSVPRAIGCCCSVLPHKFLPSPASERIIRTSKELVSKPRRGIGSMKI